MMGQHGYMGIGANGPPPLPMSPSGPPHIRGGPMFHPDFPESPMHGHGQDFSPHGMPVHSNMCSTLRIGGVLENSVNS